jgi:hypothetical protein
MSTIQLGTDLINMKTSSTFRDTRSAFLARYAAHMCKTTGFSNSQ